MLSLAASQNRPTTLTAGFTLIELSVSLLIILALVGWLVIPNQSRINNTKITQTNQQLQEIRQHLLNFFAIYKRLPCPASAQSKGKELIDTRSCQLQHGFYPSTTLATYGNRNADFLLTDAWQNPIRYSVSYIDSNRNGITEWVNSQDLLSLSATDLVLGDLQICQDTACQNHFTQQAVAVVFSQGPSNQTALIDRFNSSGSYLAGFQRRYTVNNKKQFIFNPKAADSNHYDDILLWLAPVDFVQALIN